MKSEHSRSHSQVNWRAMLLAVLCFLASMLLMSWSGFPESMVKMLGSIAVIWFVAITLRFLYLLFAGRLKL